MTFQNEHMEVRGKVGVSVMTKLVFGSFTLVMLCSLSCTGIMFHFLFRVRWKRRSMKDRWRSSPCLSVLLTSIKSSDISVPMICVICTSSNQIDLMTQTEQNDQHRNCQKYAIWWMGNLSEGSWFVIDTVILTVTILRTNGSRILMKGCIAVGVPHNCPLPWGIWAPA